MPILLFLLLPLLLFPTLCSALETDQFTVPPEPLADIGPEVDLHIDLLLRELCNAANAAGVKGSTEADLLLARDDFASTIYNELARGLPECTIESWVRSADFRAKPAKFEISIFKSIYGHSLLGRPITMIDLAPTINLGGHYVGTDKVGHFFQQGYEYYQTNIQAHRRGKSDAEALRVTVDKGIAQEEGIYGLFIIDVYSNADLATNLAGFFFYQNLTCPVRLGDHTLPPLLVFRNDAWQLNAFAGDQHLTRFVTDHWDESMNPSFYAPLLRRIVRDNIHETGAQWVAFHHTTRVAELARLEQMKTWFGLNYGHSDWKNVATIVNNYYDRIPALAAQR